MHKAPTSAIQNAAEHASSSRHPRTSLSSSFFNSSDDGDAVRDWLNDTQYSSFEHEAARIDVDLSRTPFLSSLLSDCSDGAQVVAYLQGNTYTDDVWGLPAPIQQAFEDVRTSESPSSRETAIRRLDLLRRHLDGHRGSVIPYDEWARIWDQT